MEVRLDDDEVTPAKLDHDLTTRATRRNGIVTVGDHGEMSEVTRPVTRCDSSEKRRALGTVAETERSVLDIASDESLAVAREHGGTDLEVGIRRVRMVTCFASRRDQ
jgi:hypothetical protein